MNTKNKIIFYVLFILITLLISIFLSKIFFDTRIIKTTTAYNESLMNEDKGISNNEQVKKDINKNEEESINNSDEVKGNDNFNIKISFAGDTMLASYKGLSGVDNFIDYANKKEPSYFLSEVSKIFFEDDFTIVNLENVLTDRDLVETTKNSDPAYWYKSGTKNINILSSSSVEGVSVSNNHTYDYGQSGKQDTIDAVTSANIEYGDYNRIMYFEKNNYTIAVICQGLWVESQANDIIRSIHEAEEKSDYQIVFFHGGTERIHHPEEWKMRATRKLIDNGADLVIGGHPHVLQPREIYNGKEIIYSLGNFCYGGNKSPENRTIIYQVNLEIDENSKTIVNEKSNIIPCYVFTGNVNNYQPAIIMEENIKNKVLNFMDWKEDSPV